jgi:hypothetical protein
MTERRPRRAGVPVGDIASSTVALADPTIRLVDAAMPPIARGPLRAREIWIDEALCRAARCRRLALWQRHVGAIVIVVRPGPDMQANRVSRIVRLGARRSYRDHRQNR